MNERFLPLLSIFFCLLAAHSEFFWIKVKWFSEFHFTAKFSSFKLKMQFRMVGGDKIFQPPFLSGKFTLKILTLQTYLMGWISENAGKFQAYRHKELVNRNSKIADGNCSAQVQPDACIGLVQWRTRAAARMDLYIKYLWRYACFPQWSIGIFTDILPSKIINSYQGNGGR